METGKIYLDEYGYQLYLNEIEELNNEIREIQAARRGEITFSPNERYTSIEIEDLTRKEHLKLQELQILYQKRHQIERITRHNDETKADINDTLEIEIMYAPDDIEELIIHLVATIGTNLSNPSEVSINSPLGRAIYNGSLGQIYSYMVGENKTSVHLKQKLNLEESFGRK